MLATRLVEFVRVLHTPRKGAVDPVRTRGQQVVDEANGVFDGLDDVVRAAKCTAQRRRLIRFQSAVAILASRLEALADEFKKEKDVRPEAIGHLRFRFDELVSHFHYTVQTLDLDKSREGSLRQSVIADIHALQVVVWDQLPKVTTLSLTKSEWVNRLTSAGISAATLVAKLNTFRQTIESEIARAGDAVNQMAGPVHFFESDF